MSHTNETPNYNLPQYVGTDIINPLTDTNGAYSAIDTAMKDIADGVGTGASKIEALETTVGDANSGLVKSVGDLQTQNGDITLITTAQTLSGAINELDGDVYDINTALSTAQGNITALQNKVGTDTLNTTAQTCTGAVNELKDDIEHSKTLVSVTSDGVKTRGQLIKELMDAFIALNLTNASDVLTKSRLIRVSNGANLVYKPNNVNIASATKFVEYFLTGFSISGTDITYTQDFIRPCTDIASCVYFSAETKVDSTNTNPAVNTLTDRKSDVPAVDAMTFSIVV